MEWCVLNAKRWEAEQAVARQLLGDVTTGTDSEKRAFIAGSFRLVTEHGHERYVFGIRIVYPADFPHRGQVPAVYLDGRPTAWRTGRDSHIEDDWRLCLFVPGESQIDFRQGESLQHLIACVRTFLAKEWFYQRDLLAEKVTGRTARWPGPARSHGEAGKREALRDMGGLGPNDWCLCGSGKKYKKCCMRKVEG